MSNKLIAGLFVLMFTVTSVQTLAILKLSGGNDSPSVSGVVIRDTMTAQVADTVKSEEEKIPSLSLRNVSIQYNNDGTCNVIIINENHDLEVYDGTTIVNSWGENVGCLVELITDQDDKGPIRAQSLSVQRSENGGISVSGNSPILVSQFKLLLSGYLEKDDVTGLMNTRTRSATALFQRAKGLNPTGTYNTETNTVIDQALAGVEVENITGHRFIINQ